MTTPTSTLPDLDSVLFDTSHWPVVHCRFPELEEANRVARILGGLDLILEQKQAFVMVWIPASHDHDDEPHEDEKQSTIWIKQRKAALRQFCRGYIYIATDEKLHALFEGRIETVRKLYGFPLHVTDNRADALQHAQQLLMDRNG